MEMGRFSATLLAKESQQYQLQLPEGREVRLPIWQGFYHGPGNCTAEVKWLVRLQIAYEPVSVKFDSPRPKVIAEPDDAEIVCKTPPYRHQVAAIRKMLPLPHGALFMEMGTGKTKTALDIFATKYQAGEVDSLLWLGPLNTLPHISAQVEQHLAVRAPICMIGLESLSQTAKADDKARAFVAEHGSTLLVVDEAHLCKNPFAIRTQRAAGLSRLCYAAYMLTGTPITQSPGDLFGIFMVADPSLQTIGYNSYTRFEQSHLIVMSEPRKKIIGHKNIDTLTDRLRPYIYQVKKNQCLDLPKKTFQKKYVSLTPQQERVYDMTKRELLAEYEHTMNENIIMLLFTRLQQIVGGQSPDGEPLRSHKVDAVVDALEGCEGPVVVWAKYKFEMTRIEQQIKDRPCYIMHGGIKMAERDARLTAWKGSADGVLLATPSTGGVGLDMVNASTAIYYSNSFKYVDRIQSEDRLHRIGQKESCTYIDVRAHCGIEDVIHNCLDRKEDLVQTFRQMVHDKQEDAWLRDI